MESLSRSNSGSTLSRSATPTIQQSNSRAPKDFVTRVLSPRIAVISSQDADQVCQVNNFPDFLSLIKPFGDLIEGRVNVEDSQGLKNPVENFTVRFAHLMNLEQPDVRLTSQIIAEKVKSIGKPTILDDLPPISKKSDVNEKYLAVNQDDITPWYSEYRRLFFAFIGVSEHDTFDHPVACIIAVSSSDPDIDNTLHQLSNTTPPAPIFEKGFMDPNILKYYVLLHDNHKVSLEHSEEVFEKMKRTYKLDCHLLKLNSMPLTVPSEKNDPFSVPTSPIKSSNFVTDIWTSYINENKILQALLSTPSSSQSTSSEHHSRQSSLTSLSSYSLPLSPTMSTLSSPTSSFNEEMIFSKENLGADLQNAIDFNLVGNIAPPPVIYGQYLSEEDIVGIHTFIGELVRKSLIPYMERNIRQWNEQVASSRRGITGRLFSAGRRYFSTGPKSITMNSQSAQSPYVSNPHNNNLVNPIYAYNTPEAQMRKLADYAFMLRDYKFAHSVYDTVKKDFSADKAWKCYAGAQEMIGICLLMASTNIGKDIDHYFEQSVNAFLNRAKAPFYATKATLLYYEMLKFRNLYKDAPAALVRMTSDDSDLSSAFFLEQAALAFLRCPRAMIRKYAFHMIMAGHRYGKCNQREHAYRCYLAASKVFENHSWSLVEDHIHFTLGRQSFHLGDLDASLKFFLKLLRASRQPATQQSAYLKEFLFIYKQYSLKNDKDFNLKPQELPIPIIDSSSVKVVLSNHQSNDYDEIWGIMEKEFLEEGFTGLDIYGKPRKKPSLLGSDLHRTVCAVGEPFFVQLNVHNPMHIQININDLILECEYIPLEDSSSPYEVNNEELSQKDENTDNADIKFIKFEAFDLEILPEVCLQGLEEKTISLRVLPKKQGTLKVLGLQYTLNSLVHGIKKFLRHGKRLNDTKEQRMSVVYATDRSLDLMVTSPMPLLEVAFHSFPELLFSGEVTQVVLEINNKGQKGLTDLRVKMSHPSFFCIGDAEMLEQKIYDNGSLKTEKLKIKNSIFNSNIKNIPLPQKECINPDSTSFSLAPGKTTLIPIWIRGDRIGKHMFRFLFTYESEDNNMAMKYRSLRYFKTTQVLPSLKINAFTRPSTRGLNEFILGVEIENLQSDEKFQLVQLSSISPSWIISPINNESSEDADSKSSIIPRQTIFIYYRINRIEKHSTNDNVNETNSERNDTTDITPEAFTSNALERLLIGEKNLQSEPSPINLTITNIPFRDRTINNSAKPLEGFSMNSRVQWRSNTLLNQFPFISSNKYQNIFTLYNTNDVDLALYWNISSVSSGVPSTPLQRQGHHYIVGINLGVQQNPFQGLSIYSAPNRALFEQTIRERALLLNSLSKNKNFKDDSPLKLVIQCMDIYEHDFELQSFCIVPITISIKNCSWNKKIGFTLEMISPDQHETNRSNAFHKVITPMIFHWMGSTLKYATLSANEEQTFVVKACFNRSGVYDLNRWRLTVKYDDQNASGGRNESSGGMKGYVQMPNTPHLLTIINVRK
ncbi:ER-golgi trafficking TRAPP I complex 85 kDa subunit-domain-containing protein [Rhizophagus diaphanus]|nr:ER-golgi trafficking TRAPP I complex 85 kDa subunit-domain-containing protein [Rhizophagus diaphanus] [Rhizophagus sp. MUCL 43196]